jgi:hypothetical protein
MKRFIFTIPSFPSSRPLLFSLSPFILLSFFIFVSASLHAQDRCPYKGPPLPSRTASSYVENFTITDTEGNTYDLYETLDSGMTVFIDLFFTRCSYCQQYTPIIEQIFQNTGAGEEDILMWGISNDPFDTDPVIDQYKTDYGVTNPCSGPQGGGITAHTTIIAGQNFQGWPTYCVICPDRDMFFDPVYPPTVTGFDPYFEQCASVGVDEEVNDDISRIISIYPNPVKEQLTLELKFQNDGLTTLKLYDLTGVTIMKKELDHSPGNTTVNLDLTSIPPGYYILKFSQDNQFKEAKRIIVL